jgi:hypothetical protein
MGYAVFVAVIALYALLAGHSAHGILGSAAKYGAFLAFAVALPLFCALSFAEGFVRSRRRRTGDMMSDDLH